MSATAVKEQDAAVQQETSEPSSTESQALTRPNAAASIGFGLSARNWDEGFKIAKVLAASTMVPKGYQGKPEDIVVAMQCGAEIGLPPMASLQSIAVINGKPGLYGDGFLGVIMSKPAYLRHVEYYELADGTHVKTLRAQDYQHDDTKAVTLFWRKGNAEPFEASFSIGDAKRAKLWGKEGPWAQYPGRQLRWRARSFAGRDAFPAELRGLKMAEELADYPEDVVVDVQPAGPIPEPVRRSEKAVAVDTAAPEAGPTARETSAASEPAAEPRNNGTQPKAAGRGATTQAAAGGVEIGQTVVSEHMAISDTAIVEPKGQAAHYEITAIQQEKGKAPAASVFRTTDKALYERAASCEGTSALFRIRWHGVRPAGGGKAHKELESLEAMD
jgi:hypothetical protein